MAFSELNCYISLHNFDFLQLVYFAKQYQHVDGLNLWDLFFDRDTVVIAGVTVDAGDTGTISMVLVTGFFKIGLSVIAIAFQLLSINYKTQVATIPRPTVSFPPNCKREWLLVK